MRRVRVEQAEDWRGGAVAGTDFDGWFHGWAGTSERAYALVERDDGRVEEVHAARLTFVAPPPAGAACRACGAPLDQHPQYARDGGLTGWRCPDPARTGPIFEETPDR